MKRERRERREWRGEREEREEERGGERGEREFLHDVVPLLLLLDCSCPHLFTVSKGIVVAAV